jgi:gamma-glutamyl-gamma-aminobutyrate hydrolase PuuD
MEKIIGITMIPSPQRDTLPYSYIHAVCIHGAIPFPISSTCGRPEFYAKHCDALILSGGGDIDFGNGHGQDVNRMRDLAELALIEAFIKQDKHILGICRGMQLLAWYFGTPSHDVPIVPLHSANTDIMHSINVSTKSLLYNLFESSRLFVNSAHHQCITSTPQGFIASAYTDDGTIEAIEKNNILGVQWHPERLAQPSPIFKWLIP